MAVAKRKTTGPKSKYLKKNVGALILDKLPGYFLLVCLIGSLLALFYILQPFLTSIFLAAVFAITFFPLYRKLREVMPKWERLASLLTCLFVILVIVVPTGGFFLMLAGEGLDTFQVVQEKVDSGVFDKYLLWGDGGVLFDLKEKIKPIVDVDELNVKEMIFSLAQGASDLLKNFIVALVETFSSFLVNLIVMIFSMFYFFKDGEAIVKRFGKLSPLPDVYERELFDKIVAMVNAIVFGVFLTAVLQGFVGGIGFALAGVNNSIFWGTAMAFFSIVPLIGTAVVWVPAGIVLLILGDYGAAVFIFLWGVLLVGSVDNILRTYLIGGKARTYPLITFLVILGGIWVMGLKGVIVGPLVLMVLMSFLHIYEVEYGKVLKR